MASHCTEEKAAALGVSEAQANNPISNGLSRINSCKGHTNSDLASIYETSFRETRARLDREQALRAAEEQRKIREQKEAEFMQNVATVNFAYQLRTYTSRCSISADQSSVLVDVENRYPEQVVIQGNWRIIYYGDDFSKITEDRMPESVLVTGNNRKTFLKMTLPRNAKYCRAEF